MALQQEINAQKEAIAGLEKERDFYFAKLRDIEVLLQQAVEMDPELEKEDSLVQQIQAILYSTEVQFSNSKFIVLPYLGAPTELRLAC